MSWSTPEIRVRLAPLNRFKPSSIIFYWPFQGGTFLWIFYVFVLSCVCYVFVHVCLYVLRGNLLGKGWPLGSRLWCLTVSVPLSHWYPGSGVVLDCIDLLIIAPLLTFLNNAWNTKCQYADSQCQLFCSSLHHHRYQIKYVPIVFSVTPYTRPSQTNHRPYQAKWY